MKNTEREQAIAMRIDGKSIKNIAMSLKVSKSSVSTWTRDVVLSASHKADLAKRISKNGRRTGAWIKAKLAKTDTYWRDVGFERAKTDQQFNIICAMYWGEGNKRSNSVGISNADPNFIRVFLTWVEKELIEKTELDRISYAVRYHQANGVAENDIVRHWQTEVPLLLKCNLCKCFSVKSEVGKSHLVGRCPNGTISIWVKRSRHLFMQILGGISCISSGSS